VNVKAQGLLNAATWIEETHGQTALRDVLHACSADVRERYTSAIAINWHPLSEFVEFVGAADRLLGNGDGKMAEEIGAAGARANMKGTFVRLLFYVAKPEFLMTRIAQLWVRFNDQGSMHLVEIESRVAILEVRGVDTPHRLFCATLTGWTREVVKAMGGILPLSTHAECRARGDAKCLWRIRWTNSVNDIAAREVEQGSRRVIPNAPPSIPPLKPKP
jgi:hypothetical protein